MQAATGPERAALNAVVEVSRPDVRVADLVDLGRLPAKSAERLGNILVMRLRPADQAIVVPAAALRQRLIAVAPALEPWLAADGEGQVRIRLADGSIPPKPAPAETCLRAEHAVLAGHAPTASDFAPAPCPERPIHALIYDKAARVVKASQRLNPGEVVAAAPPSLMAGVKTGDIVYVQTVVGPVKVTRRLEAIQPARPGADFFARTASGDVMAVPYPSDKK